MSTEIQDKTNIDQSKDIDQQPQNEHKPLTLLTNMTSVLTNVHTAVSPSSMEMSGSPTTMSVPVLTITSSNNSDRASPAQDGKKQLQGKMSASYRECSNCYTSDSPIWRKGPNDDKLCNKCGLYWSRHNKHRPIQITRTRTKKPEGVIKRTNSPRVNSPRINSPRINSPRINSPRVNSPMPHVGSPLVTIPPQNASVFDNVNYHSGPRFAYEEETNPSPSNLMLLLEAVQQSNNPKTPEDVEIRNESTTDQGTKRRKMMDLSGSAFKAVVRELGNEQNELRHNGSPGMKQPKTISLVNRVLLM
jgi:hypothetical protein